VPDVHDSIGHHGLSKMLQGSFFDLEHAADSHLPLIVGNERQVSVVSVTDEFVIPKDQPAGTYLNGIGSTR